MDRNDFKNMVEKYKNELMKMAGLNVKAQGISETEVPGAKISENKDAEIKSEENKQEDTFFPEDSVNAIDESESNTYQDFMDKNKEYGYLKVQAFAASQALPIEGVKVIVSKKFSDTDKIFFEGITDESGIIDDIKLPAPSKELSEHPSEILPYSNYNFSSQYEQAETDNARSVQIFQGIKTIQPIRVIL